MLLPNLIIAGPPKTGTTSLFDWMGTHPAVCASKTKETGFFSDTVSMANRKCNYAQHGLDRYADLFPSYSGQQIVMEATPEYLYSTTALTYIPTIRPVPMILFVYRDPVDRVISEYKFHKYKTKRFSGSLKSYINDHRIAPKIDPIPFFKKWVASTDSIVIILFDELKKHPDKVVKAICRKLAIHESHFDQFDFGIKNETVAIRSKKAHNIAYKLSNLIPKRIKTQLMPLYFKINSSKNLNLDHEDLAVSSELRKQFLNHTTFFKSDFERYILKTELSNDLPK